jgi:hypothetical protein
MKAIAEFVPKRLEKALDLARHIATFAKLEFKAGFIQMRLMDPSKIIHMDMILVPDTYKCDAEFDFGINLQMFYKLFRSLDNKDTVEIEADESVLKINQTVNFHTLINQDVPFGTPATINFAGSCVTVSSKLLQRYVRALGNVAPAVEINYVPLSDTLFLESVNSMYRTLFTINTSETPNEGDEYRQNFMVKFLETAINPSLSDNVNLTFGENLRIDYRPSEDLSIVLLVSGYTEG